MNYFSQGCYMICQKRPHSHFHCRIFKVICLYKGLARICHAHARSTVRNSFFHVLKFISGWLRPLAFPHNICVCLNSSMIQYIGTRCSRKDSLLHVEKLLWPVSILHPPWNLSVCFKSPAPAEYSGSNNKKWIQNKTVMREILKTAAVQELRPQFFTTSLHAHTQRIQEQV